MYNPPLSVFFSVGRRLAVDRYFLHSNEMETSIPPTKRLRK
jgi:hypothetical protein